jgi:error-prone DNA polymerase
MGFYAPAQIVHDAIKNGVEARPVDINYSFWDNTLEGTISANEERTGRKTALRLGFRQIKGMREEDVQKLLASREKHYTSINEILDAGVLLSALIQLADADAFRSVGSDRRQALWEITALKDNPFGLFKGQASESLFETNVSLPRMTLSEHVVYDYSSLSLSLKGHPVSFLRDKLVARNVILIDELSKRNDGDIVRVAGLVLVRQRPGTAGGICFMTIEDETGNANLVVFRQLFEDVYRKEILQSKLIMVEGKVQKEGEVIHVIVQHCEDWSRLLRDLTGNGKSDVRVLTLSPRDERDGSPFNTQNNKAPKRQAVQEELFPVGRNFR